MAKKGFLGKDPGTNNWKLEFYFLLKIIINIGF